MRKELGSYMPAFYHMSLSFPFPYTYDPIGSLRSKDLSVFIHEYIHFLQDVSTHVGLNNAYVFSECLHGMLTRTYKLPYGDLNVPIRLPMNYDNIDLNFFVNETSMGTFNEHELFMLKELKRECVRVPYENKLVKEMTKIILVSTQNDREIFGSCAIMESMAYLMERKVSSGYKSACDYPYHAAEIVVSKYYEDFGKDDLRIIALCDACLQFSELGKIFVDTLLRFKKDGVIPANANDIIDYFYNNSCVQMGEEIGVDMGLLRLGFAVGEQLKTYMNIPQFYPFHNVVHKLIGFGMRERLTNRYFMLDVVRNGILPDNALIRRYIREVGTPIIKDINENYWIILPFGFAPENYWIEFFPAIEQLYKCFEDGQAICEMYTWCEKSPETQTDDRCINAPWLRVRDTKLCPYAMLWKHWNLEKYFPKERNL